MKAPSVNDYINKLEPILLGHFNSKLKRDFSDINVVRESVFKIQLKDFKEGRVNNQEELVKLNKDFEKYFKDYIKYLEAGPIKLSPPKIAEVEVADMKLAEKIHDQNFCSDFSCVCSTPDELKINGLISFEYGGFHPDVFEITSDVSSNLGFIFGEINKRADTEEGKIGIDFPKYDRYYRNEKPKKLAFNEDQFSKKDSVEFSSTKYLCHFFILGKKDYLPLLKKFSKVNLKPDRIRDTFFFEGEDRTVKRKDLPIKLYMISDSENEMSFVENDYSETIFVNQDTLQDK